MYNYLKTMEQLLAARPKENRTGIDARSKTFNYLDFRLDHGRSFPALTTKRLPIKSVIGELLGFIRGADNAQDFQDLGSSVWKDNANKQNPEGMPQNKWLSSPWRKGEDDLGRIYGVQWRQWQDTRLLPSTDGNFLSDLGYKRIGQFFRKGEDSMTSIWHRDIDQLANIIQEIQTNPNSRRMIISAWNPSDMEAMALPPCHVLQHYLCEEMSVDDRIEAHIVNMENEAIWHNKNREIVRTNVINHIMHEFGNDTDPTHEQLDQWDLPRHRLNLILFQRSSDWAIGAPYNIASYAAMITIMARMTGTSPGTLHYLTGDTHLYDNHVNAAQEQVRRKPMEEQCRLLINPSLKTLEDFETATAGNFRLFNYQNHGPLSHPTPMAL